MHFHLGFSRRIWVLVMRAMQVSQLHGDGAEKLEAVNGEYRFKAYREVSSLCSRSVSSKFPGN